MTPRRARSGAAGTPDPAAQRLGLRPLARATRAGLFRREVRERLSPGAIDLIFRHAEVMSEGQRETRGGRSAYFGSTMLTIDLAALAPALREPCDAGTAKRLAELAAGDAEFEKRAKAIAAAEAARLAATRLGALAAEMRVRADGARVHVDVDVEAAP